MKSAVEHAGGSGGGVQLSVRQLLQAQLVISGKSKRDKKRIKFKQKFASKSSAKWYQRAMEQYIYACRSIPAKHKRLVGLTFDGKTIGGKHRLMIAAKLPRAKRSMWCPPQALPLSLIYFQGMVMAIAVRGLYPATYVANTPPPCVVNAPG